MKHLLAINPDNITDVTGLKERIAVRAVVTDSDGKIALLNATASEYHKLPGGGVEKDEDFMEALRRECLEEIGCEIEVTGELGIIEEFRKTENLHQVSYCYVAKVIGEKGTPDFTESEKRNGFEIVWVKKEEGLKLLQENKTADRSGSFIKLRDIAFVEEYFTLTSL